MSKKDESKPAALVKARVLVAGAYGKVDAVVELSEAEAAAGKESGALDPHPDAVAYAESLASA